MEQNYIRYDLRRNSKCRWSDNELYQSRQGTNPQYKHVYAYDGKGRIACFTARVPSNKVQKAPSQHQQESGYNELKNVLKFYKPPEISSCAIHPPKSSSVVKYDDYPKMYAKHKVDHDIQHYKESSIDENHGSTGKGKHTKSTNTPYSFLFCSEYLKQRLDRKATNEEVEQDAYYKNKDLLVKPETQDVSCGSIFIRKKSSSGNKRLKRIKTSKRIKRLVIYKKVYHTIKELEHLFKVSKSKWEMAMAKASEESVKESALIENSSLKTQTSHSQSSSSTVSEVKIVMTTSHTAITPFEFDIPKISESSPAISSSATPLRSEHENEGPPPVSVVEPPPQTTEKIDLLLGTNAEESPQIVKEVKPSSETNVAESSQTNSPIEQKVLSTTGHTSQIPMVEMKDVSTECCFKKKRRRSSVRKSTIGFMCDLSSVLLKELQCAIRSIPKMSYLILVTFYSLP